MASTVSLSNNSNEIKNNTIIAYPNPSNNMQQICFTNIGRKALVKIFDITGKIVFINRIDELEKINVMQKQGIYLYQIETVNKIVSGKLIIY